MNTMTISYDDTKVNLNPVHITCGEIMNNTGGKTDEEGLTWYFRCFNEDCDRKGDETEVNIKK